MGALVSFLGGSVFRMIWGELSAAWTKYQAEDAMNLINCEAEQVGCHYEDKAQERRYDARRAAEARRRSDIASQWLSSCQSEVQS